MAEGIQFAGGEVPVKIAENEEGSILSKAEKIKQAFTAYECGKSRRGL